MRLVSFQRYRTRGLGALLDTGEVVDLRAAAVAYLTLVEDDPCAEAEAELRMPDEVAGFLTGGAPSGLLAEKALQFALKRGAAGGIDGEPLLLAPGSVRLRPPLAAPLVIATGATFVQRLDHPGGARADHTEFYLRNPRQVLGPADEIPYQSWVTEHLHAEACVGVVIGRRIRCVAADEAAEAIYGYCPITDLAAQELHTLSWAGPLFHIQYAQGKTFDGSMAMGPVVAKRAAGQIGAARLLVDGRVAVETDLAALVADAPRWVSYLSDFVTLQPGSVILLGSSDSTRTGELPEGAKKLSVHHPAPPAGTWLRPGMQVAVEVEGLGRVENRIRQAEAADFVGRR